MATLGELETMADWNALLGSCCCNMPLCPVPVKVCESLSAHFQSQGHINPASLTFELFKKKGTTGFWERTDTILFEDTHPDVDGEPSQIMTIDIDTFYGELYTRLYHGGIGSGGEGCPYWGPETPGITCEATGTSNKKNYYAFGYTNEEEESVAVSGLGLEVAAVVEDVSGEETAEHIAWETEFADEIAAWDAAHPDGPTWQEANTSHDDWQVIVDNYTQWEANRDGWVAEDPENRDPEDYGEIEAPPPEPGDEPETAGVDDEPTATYPECWFKVTATITYYPFFFNGYPDVPDVDDPADEAAFDAWVEAGASGDAPAPGTYQVSNYGAWSTVYTMMDPGFSGAPLYAETTGYPNPPEPTDYAAWVLEVRALVDAQATFPKPGCIGTNCESSYSITPAPPASPPATDAYDDIIMDADAGRYRWQIPSTWLDQFTGLPTTFTGTYFKIGWNVVEEPTGWDDTIDDPDYEPPEEEPEDGWPPVPQIPKPGRPNRSFIPFPDAEEGEDENEWLWEWEGPGDPMDPETWLSDFFDLGIPAVNGRRYVANIRFFCQPDSPWGTLPQTTGESVEIPPPEEDP